MQLVDQQERNKRFALDNIHVAARKARLTWRQISSTVRTVPTTSHTTTPNSMMVSAITAAS
jgi:hypothetical protein